MNRNNHTVDFKIVGGVHRMALIFYKILLNCPNFKPYINILYSRLKNVRKQ